MMKHLITLPLILLGLFSGSLMANASEGGSVRGGGDEILFNGEWKVKDLFIRNYFAGSSYHLSSKAVHEISTKLVPMVEVYTGVIESGYWEEVFGEQVDIRIVDEKDYPCAKATRSSAAEVNYGCTLDKVTYLLKERFLPLSPYEKILRILHQRAHAFDPSEKAHDWIEPFIQGINLICQLKGEQEKNHFRMLKGKEVAVLETLSSEKIRTVFGKGSLSSAGLGANVVSPHGGGIIITHAYILDRLTLVDDQSYLGVGSVLSLASEHCSIPYGMALIAHQSKVLGSYLECATVDASVIRNSRIRYFSDSQQAHTLNTIGHSVIVSSDLATSSGIQLDSVKFRQSEIFSRANRMNEIKRTKMISSSIKAPVSKAIQMEDANLLLMNLTW